MSNNDFVIGTLRVTGLLRQGETDSTPRNVCIVQSKISASDAETIQARVTAAEYRTLQNAYDHFNLILFNGSLPQVLITLQRKRGTRGYFSADRFQRRNGPRERIHELALNPSAFAGRTDREILSTLVHGMVHVWQQEHGRPGRGRYHNREWAAKMHSIGLMPSTTGKPGGAVTGERVSHYILEDGAFAAACEMFLERYRLLLESVDDDNRNVGPGRTRTPTKNQTRMKFSCPNCGLNVWAKPNALIDCHRCSDEAHEAITMRACHC